VIPVRNAGKWNHLQIIQKYLNNITGKHDIKELQKIATRDIAHILMKVLI
jgi:hypothetical protein